VTATIVLIAATAFAMLTDNCTI